MFLPPQLSKKVTLPTVLYMTAYCFAQFFLPFGLVLLPLDVVDGTYKSVSWLIVGIAGYAFLGKRVDAAHLWALVFVLAAAYSGLVLLRFGVECVLLQSSRCDTSLPMTHRTVLVGCVSFAYLLMGLILVGVVKRKRLKERAQKNAVNQAKR